MSNTYSLLSAYCIALLLLSFSTCSKEQTISTLPIDPCSPIFSSSDIQLLEANHWLNNLKEIKLEENTAQTISLLPEKIAQFEVQGALYYTASYYRKQETNGNWKNTNHTFVYDCTGNIIIEFPAIGEKRAEHYVRQINSESELLTLLAKRIDNHEYFWSTNKNESKLALKAQEALYYVEDNFNMNQDFCILVDMSYHSGLNRFFVWSFIENKVIDQGLASHGFCSNSENGIWSKDNTKDNPTFGNELNTGCSSLGKFKTGQRIWSSWGINIQYRLHGLENTNNNAFERNIVLHSWNQISDTETYPKGTVEGGGCPAVSDNFMRRLDTLLLSTDYNTLLWIYQ